MRKVLKKAKEKHEMQDPPQGRQNQECPASHKRCLPLTWGKLSQKAETTMLQKCHMLHVVIDVLKFKKLCK